MILILVNTTSQLINAIVLAETVLKNEKCDLYYTPEVKVGIDNLPDTNIFNNIYRIELVHDICSRDSELKRAIVRIKNAMDFGKVKKSLPSDPLQYSRVFASGISLRNFEFYYSIKYFNPTVQLSLFEEGSCEYYTLGLPKSKIRSLFSHFFFGHYYLEECDSLYVFNPPFVQNIWEGISIERIPNYSNNQEILNVLNSIFGYEHEILNTCCEKVIILEQAFANEESEKRQVELISHISEVAGKENVVLKLHPRSSADKYSGKYKAIKTSIPFELLMANEMAVDKIFISISSSATLNLKLIFDIEPYIIILNRLRRENAVLGEGDKLYSRIQSSCENQHFFIPDTLQEVDDILKKIL